MFVHEEPRCMLDDSTCYILVHSDARPNANIIPLHPPTQRSSEYHCARHRVESVCFQLGISFQVMSSEGGRQAVAGLLSLAEIPLEFDFGANKNLNYGLLASQTLFPCSAHM